MKKTILTVLAVLMLAAGASTAQKGYCPDTLTIISDSQTQVDGHGSVEVTPHPAWASIGGAKWIWYQDESLNDPFLTEVKTFTRTFNVVGTPTSGILQITADNGFNVSVNGQLVDNTRYDVPDQNNQNYWYFKNVYTYDITSKLVSGQNTISVEVQNVGIPPGTTGENPGGTVYRIDIEEECDNIPLPEYASAAIPLLVLVMAPAAAYVLVRRKK